MTLFNLSLTTALFAALMFPPETAAQSVPVPQSTGMTGSIRGLDVVSSKIVWISGSKGEFSVTKDGGKTWFHQVVPGAAHLDFRDVHGFSDRVALLMAAGPGKGSAIYRTIDGGATWVVTYQNNDEKAFFDGMDFFDDRHGLLIGDPIDAKPYLMETQDGGVTWARLSPASIPDLVPGEYAFAASGTSLDACADGTCLIVTGGAVARVFRSADRGANWSVTPLLFLQDDPAAGAFSVARGPRGKVVAAGGHYQKMKLAGSNIALSADDGNTWTIPDGASRVPFMECVRHVRSKTWVACGPPGIWISTDNGQNWTEVTPDGMHAMDVTPSGKMVWFAGNGGSVMKMVL